MNIIYQRNTINTLKTLKKIATGGYGIYVVFWFDFNEQKACPNRNGQRPPKTAQELQGQLQQTLIEEESQRISVLVIDCGRDRSMVG